MQRRKFISLVGGAAALPLAARAQQAAKPVVGFLSSSSPASVAHLLPSYRQGLNDTGFMEGQNVTIEYRFAEGQFDRLPELVADLIRQKPALIVAAGSSPAALAAKAATRVIPILFAFGSDPAKLGLVASLNKPDGNLTGVNFFTTEVGSKLLGLLRQLLPSATRVGALVNPDTPTHEDWAREVMAAASALANLRVDVVTARNGREIEAAFSTLIQNRVGGVVVAGDSLFFTRRIQLATLAARHGLPSIYSIREHAVAGGLMSYGAKIPDAYRQLGIYTGRILKGAKPADLPVVQSTTFELVINVNTARALGVTVPDDLLTIADEVIE
jgi:putative ABC transport system substrate-binding protein